MDHVNYEQWADFIANLADMHGSAVKVIYDISCGTGTLSYKMAERGYSVIGSDLCVDMVKIATVKRKAAAGFPCFWCSDLSYSPIKIQPDMVVSLYDSMNYLQKLNQWELAINNIFTQLKPDGLFIFDVSTLFNSKTFFLKNFYRRECNDGFYTRRSSFDEKRMIQHNIFEIRLNQHPDTVYIEHHRQIIRTLQQILLIVKRTHFKMVGCYAEFSLRPGTEKAKRVHFVLKK